MSNNHPNQPRRSDRGKGENKMKEIAMETLKQLGGNRFLAMTGAKNIVYDKKMVAFKLPRFAGVKVNYVKIILNDMDLYNMEFGRITPKKGYQILDSVSDVYNDMLQDVFTEKTGLDTHL